MVTNYKALKKKILITGGAGFIGSALIRFLINQTENEVLNLDKLTYASDLQSLKIVSSNSRYQFVKGDICDKKIVSKIFKNFQPDIVMHLAAESHVDRSIDGPKNFIQTNITGTLVMLESARQYWNNQNNTDNFLFHHISTDEVYGSLIKTGSFTEKSNYNPSSPYSASKASSDHLVRSWYHTYGLPVVITNCSNNYGPYQFPEKLIPVTILNALERKSLPVYGNGENIRDWLHVEDHVSALYRVICYGKLGETYNVGGNNEKTNIDVVNIICEILDKLVPPQSKNKKIIYKMKNLKRTKRSIKSYKDLITFVKDRPGHDFRYAVNANKIKKKLDWKPKETFETGIEKTIKWYLDNLDWCKNVKNKKLQSKYPSLL